jgi:palmitoyltransferase
MGVTLALFFIYHLFMVRANTTTNERIKRSDFLEYFQM